MTQTLQCTNTLRWRQVPTTTTQPAVLEQAWQDITTGVVTWVPVPLVIKEPGA